jgi:hypothetical protein
VRDVPLFQTKPGCECNRRLQQLVLQDQSRVLPRCRRSILLIQILPIHSADAPAKCNQVRTRATASVNSTADYLTWTAKESAAQAGPVRATRKSHLAASVRKTIFFVGRIFNAVLLPDFTHSDTGQRPTGGIQGGDRPVWCDCLRYRNESWSQYHCCDGENFVATSQNSNGLGSIQSN